MTDEVIAPETVETPTETADAKPVETPQPKERDKVQERIGELTRKNAKLEQQLNELLSKKQEEPKQELKAPKLEDSGYDEDAHRDAMQRYYEAIAERKAEEAAAKLIEKREAEAKAKAKDQTFTERLKKLSGDDYDLAVSAPVGSQEAADVIKESELAPEILLYLANNRGQAEKIAQLPPYVQAREIGRIEARLEMQKTQAEQKPKVSEAPPPPPKIEATTAVIDKDPDKMSVNEWLKWREKQLRKR